jgi:sigma-B regulation protein RsbU (phosphoserine phosphatase)
MIDPIRFKRLLIQILKLLIIIELIGALAVGLSGGGWGRFGNDLIIAGILYITWDRITALLRERKALARERVERAGVDLRIRDALLFSVLWSDEITNEIPEDRRRMVIAAYTLIALGLVLAYVQIGAGLMSLVVSGVVVLGGVNLLAWLVSLEREGKETLQTELRLAHEVQVSLMPEKQPVLEGYDIAGMSLPAQEVGGDLFDFASPNHMEGLCVSVVDVSGKGMQAAMAAVFTSGALASELKQNTTPAGILTDLNHAVFHHSRRGHFVAFLSGCLAPHEKVFTFANAGQTKPLLRRGETVQWLDGKGPHFPLGMQAGTVYDNCRLELQQGDILFLLTDGFTEAMNDARDSFGPERVERTAAAHDLAGLSAADILQRITAEVQAFAGTAAQHDDMTLVVIKVL